MEGSSLKSMFLCWTRSLTAHTIATGQKQNQKEWENKEWWVLAKEKKFEQKWRKEWQQISQAAHPYSSRVLLRRSSHLYKATHFQRIPQQSSTNGTNPALLPFQEHQVFFGHRAPQTAMTSLFLLHHLCLASSWLFLLFLQVPLGKKQHFSHLLNPCLPSGGHAWTIPQRCIQMSSFDLSPFVFRSF